MNEPRRLLQEDPGDVERLLLSSAHDDEPQAGDRARLLAALALGAGAATIAAGASAAGAAAGGATKVASAGLFSLAKWVGVGVLGAGFLVGGAAAVTDTTAPPVVAMRGQEAVVAQVSRDVRARATLGAMAPDTIAPGGAAEASSVATSGPDAAAVPSIAKSSPAAAPRSSTAARQSVSPGAAAPAEPTLADEVAALDKAREALASRDPDAALAALREHDRTFTNAALSPEALVLRIEALVAGGRDAEARQLAAGYLASHPASPHARRIRSLLARAAPPADPDARPSVGAP